MPRTPLFHRILFWIYLLSALAVGGLALLFPQVRAIAYAPLREALLPAFVESPFNPRVRIAVATAPELEAWVRESAAMFMEANPRYTIEVSPLRGAEASRQLSAISDQTTVWIAESRIARQAAGELPFERDGAVMAQDYLVWAVVAANSYWNAGAEPSWDSISRYALEDPQFRLAAPPAGSLDGYSACLSAAGEFFRDGTLEPNQLSQADFRTWLDRVLEAAPDLSRNPRDQMTSRPPQADAALLWHSDTRLLGAGLFRFQPARYRVLADHPFIIRTAWPESAQRDAALLRGAAEDFRAFLLSDGRQAALSVYGLERADAALPGDPLHISEEAVRFLPFCW